MGTLAILLPGFMLTFMSWLNSPVNTYEIKAESGIYFHQGTWDEVLQLAKKEGKPIFLDISASWCGPCKRLKANTFTDPEVGELFNSRFINVLVDGEEGEGIHLAGKYRIRGYPSLIFIDSDGQLVGQTAGYRTSEQLIEIGKQILVRLEIIDHY